MGDQLHAQIKRMRQQNSSTAKSDGAAAGGGDASSAAADASGHDQPHDIQLLLEQAEAKGERKLELKIKKLRIDNRTLTKRLVEAQRTVDRMSQQSTNNHDKHSIYKTNSEKFLTK